MSGRIEFYEVSGTYGAFSNFSPHEIELDGKVWPTVEHWFQARKFEGSALEERIRRAATPQEAARLCPQRGPRLVKGWESKRVEVMLVAQRAKFTQHPELRELLLGTGAALLVEHTRRDRFWADGGDGSGRNMLGRLLMRVRRELGSQVA